MKAEELELELEKEVENEILFHAIEDEINSVDEVKTLNNNSNLANEKKKKKRKNL